ncbi:hypothetical protein EVAR_30944_1 [Eumeta japonica]|uniref:Uncharacterized protein n=1 Tax=Eumeta variegata TaxID=151549 RepID=A0A4C1V5R3_EUMVA|nr:hypothetical protein EVAR_30944_1 [Eumeta japonica]
MGEINHYECLEIGELCQEEGIAYVKLLGINNFSREEGIAYVELLGINNFSREEGIAYVELLGINNFSREEGIAYVELLGINNFSREERIVYVELLGINNFSREEGIAYVELLGINNFSREEGIAYVELLGKQITDGAAYHLNSGPLTASVVEVRRDKIRLARNVNSSYLTHLRQFSPTFDGKFRGKPHRGKFVCFTIAIRRNPPDKRPENFTIKDLDLKSSTLDQWGSGLNINQCHRCGDETQDRWLNMLSEARNEWFHLT